MTYEDRPTDNPPNPEQGEEAASIREGRCMNFGLVCSLPQPEDRSDASFPRQTHRPTRKGRTRSLRVRVRPRLTTETTRGGPCDR